MTLVEHWELVRIIVDKGSNHCSINLPNPYEYKIETSPILWRGSGHDHLCGAGETCAIDPPVWQNLYSACLQADTGATSRMCVFIPMYMKYMYAKSRLEQNYTNIVMTYRYTKYHYTKIIIYITMHTNRELHRKKITHIVFHIF